MNIYMKDIKLRRLAIDNHAGKSQQQDRLTDRRTQAFTFPAFHLREPVGNFQNLFAHCRVDKHFISTLSVPGSHRLEETSNCHHSFPVAVLQNESCAGVETYSIAAGVILVPSVELCGLLAWTKNRTACNYGQPMSTLWIQLWSCIIKNNLESRQTWIFPTNMNDS